MSKPNEGYVFQRGNKWVARVTFTDSTGKRREQWRTGKNEHHARELLAGMLATLETTKASTAIPDANDSGLTFKQIAAQYSAHKVKPAQYRNDRKIAGMRSVRTVRLRIAVLVEYFGDTDISRITPATVERFKIERLETPTRHKTERSIASVNRVLLRSLLILPSDCPYRDKRDYEYE